MNIAMISYWSCPLAKLGISSAGGMNVYVLSLANSLGRLGHVIDIYTRAHKENHEKVININPNVRVIHLPTEFPNLYKDIEFYYQKMSDFIQKNFLCYDIIHGHYFYSGLIGLLLKKTLKRPLVMNFHTLAASKELYFGIKDPVRKDSEQKIVQKASAMIVSTELEKKEILRSYKADKEKVFIVYPGVNHHVFKKHGRKLSFLKLHLSTKKKIILFVGRIDPIKGIRVLIEAFIKLLKENPSLGRKIHLLLIGGDIKDRSFWQNTEVRNIVFLIKKQHLENVVEFLGSKQYNLLPYYYSVADIMVAPSFYESFGLAVLEAMACGTCILASKVGGLEYTVNNGINGRLFESGNMEELCQALWELLNDEKQRFKLGKQAMVDSQKFCWDKQAKKTLKIYNQFL